MYHVPPDRPGGLLVAFRKSERLGRTARRVKVVFLLGTLALAHEPAHTQINRSERSGNYGGLDEKHFASFAAKQRAEGDRPPGKGTHQEGGNLMMAPNNSVSADRSAGPWRRGQPIGSCAS